jgi:hypothetical protein
LSGTTTTAGTIVFRVAFSKTVLNVGLYRLFCSSVPRSCFIWNTDDTNTTFDLGVFATTNYTQVYIALAPAHDIQDSFGQCGQLVGVHIARRILRSTDHVHIDAHHSGFGYCGAQQSRSLPAQLHRPTLLSNLQHRFYVWQQLRLLDRLLNTVTHAVDCVPSRPSSPSIWLTASVPSGSTLQDLYGNRVANRPITATAVQYFPQNYVTAVSPLVPRETNARGIFYSNSTIEVTFTFYSVFINSTVNVADFTVTGDWLRHSGRGCGLSVPAM